MRPKKAQAATEYMMTYGWAIMVILIVFGTIYYYVDFSGPNTCKIDAPFVCEDVKAAVLGTDLKFELSIEGSEIQSVSGFTFTTNKGGTCTGGPNGASADFGLQKIVLGTVSTSRQVIPVYCTGFTFKTGDTIDGTLSITYQKLGKLGHVAAGIYHVTVE